MCLCSSVRMWKVMGFLDAHPFAYNLDTVKRICSLFLARKNNPPPVTAANSMLTSGSNIFETISNVSYAPCSRTIKSDAGDCRMQMGKLENEYSKMRTNFVIFASERHSVRQATVSSRSRSDEPKSEENSVHSILKFDNYFLLYYFAKLPKYFFFPVIIVRLVRAVRDYISWQRSHIRQLGTMARPATKRNPIRAKQ